MEVSLSPEEDDKKFKRSYKACLNCRTRKVKCDGWDSQPPCSRCKRERKECIFVESKRGGQANVIAGRKRKAEVDAETKKKIPGNASMNQLWPHEVQQKFWVDSSLDGGSPSIEQENSRSRSKLYEQSLPPPTALLQTKDGEVLNPYTRKMLSMGQTSEMISLKRGEDSGYEAQGAPKLEQQDDGRDAYLRGGTGALQFLAKAAGNIARADQRDRIDGLERHTALVADSVSKLTSHSNSDIDTTRKSSLTPNHSMSNTPSNTAGSPELAHQTNQSSAIPPMIRHDNSSSRVSMPLLEDLQSVRPRPSSKLGDIEYIGINSILTESAARKFVNLFFSTMHPFFPHIPPDLMDPDILAGYPILLCAILTISSRYHSFEELEGDASFVEDNQGESVPKNVEVHERLWVYCQRLISQTVWAEASTRSIGTVFAFLLFTEWNPRAIHWRWSDYANSDESSKPISLDVSEEGVAGLGAMRRSARMGWMLIGSAVRLAQDMGFMENSSRIFLACHVSETFAAMNVSKRSMLSNSLSEIDLESDDEEEDHLKNAHKSKRKSKNKEADEIDLVLRGDEETLRLKTGTRLKFSRIQKAKIELLQIMSICYETLYGSQPKLDGLDKRENLAVLNILSPLLKNWFKTYSDMLNPTSGSHFSLSHNQNHSSMMKPQSKYIRDIGKQLDIESLIFDYHYARLYVYSLALTDYSKTQSQPPTKKRSHHLRLDELTKSSKYVELAFNASKEMLACTQRLHKIKMLKYMPVRWVTRIVRAAAFVVKCYLTLTATQGATGNVNSSIMSLTIIPLDEIISIIQKVAITLREASPDELHLCTRYSTILMYLCSEMKSKIANKSSRSVYNTSLDDTEAQQYSEDDGTSFDHQPSMNYAPQMQYTSPRPISVQQRSDEPGHHREQANPYHHQLLQQQQQQQSVFSNQNQPQEKTSPSTNKSRADYDIFAFPTDTVFDWFRNDNGGGIGLDFVEPWTEMIEHQININKID